MLATSQDACEIQYQAEQRNSAQHEKQNSTSDAYNNAVYAKLILARKRNHRMFL